MSVCGEVVRIADCGEINSPQVRRPGENFLKKGIDKNKKLCYTLDTIKRGEKKMARCADSNCGYYWQDKDEDYPRCHYPDDGFPAPCEYDDFEEGEY